MGPAAAAVCADVEHKRLLLYNSVARRNKSGLCEGCVLLMVALDDSYLQKYSILLS